MSDESEADEEVTQCDACKFEGVPVKAYTDSGVGIQPQTLMLCEVCASTVIGNMARNPQLYQNYALYRTLGWVANKILVEMRVLWLRDELGKHRPKPGDGG